MFAARSSSQATLDSLDFTRYSEDGERGVDERVAVLEFELRKAKETINFLRANLTDATTGNMKILNQNHRGIFSINDEATCLHLGDLGYFAPLIT